MRKSGNHNRKKWPISSLFPFFCKDFSWDFLFSNFSRASDESMMMTDGKKGENENKLAFRDHDLRDGRSPPRIEAPLIRKYNRAGTIIYIMKNEKWPECSGDLIRCGWIWNWSTYWERKEKRSAGDLQASSIPMERLIHNRSRSEARQNRPFNARHKIDQREFERSASNRGREARMLWDIEQIFPPSAFSSSCSLSLSAQSYQF